jgi:chromosome segregation ATPase
MDIKQLKTNDNIQFGRKQFPKDKILIVGEEINEKEYEALITMGKEISVLEGNVPVGPSVAELEISDLKEQIVALREFNEGLKKELHDAEKERDSLKALLEKAEMDAKPQKEKGK